jgi:hypothetical protein
MSNVSHGQISICVPFIQPASCNLEAFSRIFSQVFVNSGVPNIGGFVFYSYNVQNAFAKKKFS